MRKFDFYGQIVLIGIGGVSGLMSLYQGGYIIFAILMLIPLGLWQLISAALLTFNKTNPENRTILKFYWIFVAICLIIFIAAFNVLNGGTNFQIGFVFTSMCLSFLVALYYLYLYKRYFLAKKVVNLIEAGI